MISILPAIGSFRNPAFSNLAFSLDPRFLLAVSGDGDEEADVMLV